MGFNTSNYSSSVFMAGVGCGYRSSNIDVEGEVFVGGEHQAGRRQRESILVLIFILSVNIIDVSAKVLLKQSKDFVSTFKHFIHQGGDGIQT